MVHPAFSAFAENPSSIPHAQVWDWTIRKLVGDVMLDCEVWRAVMETFQEIKSANEVQNPAGSPMSQRVLDAYLLAYCGLRRIIPLYIRTFDSGELLYASPEIRRYMMRLEPAQSTSLGESGRRRFNPKAETQDDKDRWTLLNLFRFLLDEKSAGTIGLRNVTNALAAMTASISHDDGLEGINITSSSARALECQRLLSTLVQKKVSTLFALTEMYHLLESFHPWIELCLQSTKAKYPSVFNDRFGLSLVRLEVFRNRLDRLPDTVLQAAMPRGRKFDYPISQAPTQQLLQKLVVSERNLDSFWHYITQVEVIGPLSPYLKSLLIGQSIYRTPVLAETSRQEQQPPRPWANPSPARYQPPESFSQLSIQDSQGRSPRAPRIKAKTRGLAGSPALKPEKVDVAVPTSPYLMVDSEEMAVLSMLFYQPGQNHHSGDIKWSSFVKLMVRMGFEAEQLWGSAWKFAPASGSMFEDQGSIIFHAPHGRTTKLSFTYARLHGGRLTRRYGLDSSNFRLRE